MDTSLSLTDPKITTTRMKGSLAFGVIKANTLVTNVQLKMPRATSAKSKGISSELAYVEKHVQDQKRTIKMTNDYITSMHQTRKAVAMKITMISTQ